jgi:hypothetical protein
MMASIIIKIIKALVEADRILGEIEVIIMRKKIKFFVCYAHKNHLIVDDFLNRLEDVLGPSKAHEYILWRDLNIAVGEEWDKEIKKSLNLAFNTPNYPISPNYAIG